MSKVEPCPLCQIHPHNILRQSLRVVAGFMGFRPRSDSLNIPAAGPAGERGPMPRDYFAKTQQFT